jgi:hypothetical protein
MKLIRFFKNIKGLNGAGVIGTLGGTCLALIGFLMQDTWWNMSCINRFFNGS